MLGSVNRWFNAAKKALTKRTSPLAPGAAPPIRTKASSSSDELALLNRLVPLKDATDTQESFVRRETVLNSSEKVAGYEFSLLVKLQDRLLHRGGMARRAYDTALLTRMNLNQVTSLLGNRLAFVNLSIESLNNPLIDSLPKQNTELILEVTHQPSDWNSALTRVDALRRNGYAIGLRIQGAEDATCPLIDHVDMFQVDVTGFDGLDLKNLISRLRSNDPTRTRIHSLLARNLQSHDDYLFAQRCGFDLFQGPFVSSRQSLRPFSSGSVNRAALLPILKLVQAGENFDLIAQQLKSEPTLSYKLLRYLNSPAIGLQQRIDNLTQALMLVGHEKFYRWTSLLFFDFANPGFQERCLAERALVRARTLEMLAGKGRIPESGDLLFLLGLFSLLDVVLAKPMAEVLSGAAVPQSVADALLGVPGPYADALMLAMLGEADMATEPAMMALALQQCEILDSDYATVTNEALIWADQMLGEVG